MLFRKAVTLVLAMVAIAGCGPLLELLNDPPAADAGEDQIVELGQSIQLDGSDSSDPNGDILLFEWEMRTTPQGSGLDSSNIVNRDSERASFTPDTVGVYVIRLSASDQYVSTQDNVEVTVVGPAGGDIASINIDPVAGLITTEAGGTASFTVVLATQPTSEVMIGLNSSDTTEGTVFPTSLTFTTTNWSTAQTVTVTGEDDGTGDGDQAYTIVTAAAISSDASYNGIDPSDVSVSNIDDPSYAVTYIGNGNTGGNPPTDTNTYESGSSATVAAEGSLVRTNYTFVGWNTISDGSGSPYTAGETFAIGSSNVTLYAQWTASATYTVTYDGNGATGGSVPVDNSNYVAGQTATVLGNTGSLLQVGYTFGGWNTSIDGTGSPYAEWGALLIGTENIVLYAQWVGAVSVIYDGNGATSGSAPLDTTVYEDGETAIVIGNTGNLQKTGYSFAVWNTASDGSGEYYGADSSITVSTTDVLLFAQWTLNSYTVSYDENGATTGGIPSGPAQHDFGTPVVVLGNTGNLSKSGIPFRSWNTAEDGSGVSYMVGDTFTMGPADTVLYAQFSGGAIQVDQTNTTMQSSGLSLTLVPIVAYGLTGEFRGMTVTSYALSATEITQGDYQSVMGTNPSTNALGDNFPVETVTWYEAVVFCNSLSTLAGLEPVYNESNWQPDFAKTGFYLPTEAQWVFAAGGPNHYLWSLGDTFVASNYTWNTNLPTQVKSHPANEYGLYDMSGNVSEWLTDWYGGNYPYSGQTDPVGPTTGSALVANGGNFFVSNSDGIQTDIHGYAGSPTPGDYRLGFRVALGGFGKW